MTLLNKVCQIVSITSRECQCVFMAEGVHSGCSPGLFAHVPSFQGRSSSRRLKQGCISVLPLPSCTNSFSPSTSFSTIHATPSAFQPVQEPSPCLQASLCPHHIPTLPCTSTHASALVTPGFSNLVMPLNPALAFCILTTECKSSSCLGAWSWLVTVCWMTWQWLLLCSCCHTAQPCTVAQACTSALQWSMCCLEDSGQCTSSKTGQTDCWMQQ